MRRRRSCSIHVTVAGLRSYVGSFGLPREILPELLETGYGTRIGMPSVAEDIGLSQAVRVIVPGTHDTASAVAAVPVIGP